MRFLRPKSRRLRWAGRLGLLGAALALAAQLVLGSLPAGSDAAAPFSAAQLARLAQAGLICLSPPPGTAPAADAPLHRAPRPALPAGRPPVLLALYAATLPPPPVLPLPAQPGLSLAARPVAPAPAPMLPPRHGWARAPPIRT